MYALITDKESPFSFISGRLSVLCSMATRNLGGCCCQLPLHLKAMRTPCVQSDSPAGLLSRGQCASAVGHASIRKTTNSLGTLQFRHLAWLPPSLCRPIASAAANRDTLHNPIFGKTLEKKQQPEIGYQDNTQIFMCDAIVYHMSITCVPNFIYLAV